MMSGFWIPAGLLIREISGHLLSRGGFVERSKRLIVDWFGSSSRSVASCSAPRRNSALGALASHLLWEALNLGFLRSLMAEHSLGIELGHR